MTKSELVRRLACALPEVEDRSTVESLHFHVRGKQFAWSWQEHTNPNQARRPRIDVLAVRCAPEAKESILASDTDVFFIEEHYRDFPAVLVRLEKVSDADLRALLEAAWCCQAPRLLVRQWLQAQGRV